MPIIMQPDNDEARASLGASEVKPPIMSGKDFGVASDADVRIREGTWEYALASKYPTTATVARTVADIVPFMWTLFDTGRQDFMRSGDGWKALQVGLDLAVILPPAKLFKGARSLMSTTMRSTKVPAFLRMADRTFKSLSVAEEALPIGSKFESVSLLEKIKSTYKLGDEEALGLLKGEKDITVWKQTTHGFYGDKPSNKFYKLMRKGNYEKVREQISYWANTPLSQQRADFYAEAWKKRLSTILGEDISFNAEGMFRAQMEKLVGEGTPIAKLAEASADDMANVFLQTFNEPKLIRKIGSLAYGSMTPTLFLPTRKAFGLGEATYGTFTRFEKIKGLFSRARSYELMQTTNLLTRMQEAGLGKVAVKKGIVVGFKKSPLLTKEVWNRYGQVVREIDDISMGKLITEEVKSSGAKIDELIEHQIANRLQKEPKIIQDLINKVHQPFHDDLYKDFALNRIPQVILDSGLNASGMAKFKGLWEGEKGYVKIISEIFNPTYDPPRGTRVTLVKEILDTIRKEVKPNWFSERSEKELAETLQNIERKLTLSTKGQTGFPNYLENYAIRIGQETKEMINLRFSELGKTPQASFMKSRFLDQPGELITDPSRMLQARIAAQAKELHFYPYAKEHFKAIRKLPEDYRTYFDYWFGRMLGEPTMVDHYVARWLTALSGGLDRILGREVSITADRVKDLAYKINDAAYLGGLGFKPYAIVRNLFQPLTTVPTDLGGLKDIGWLIKGYKRALNSETREMIRSWGAIADYAEELGSKNLIPKFGIKVGRFQAPELQQLRDYAMWAFKKSDEFNRYVTGGAALEKWDYFAQRYLQKGNLDIGKFKKKMRFRGREDWVRRQLEELIERIPKETSQKGINVLVDNAKAKFVTDVIADTQWLYGAAESPLISSRFGVISKTGVIFQSWWMNYMSSLEKWFTRGPGWQRADRFATWIISSAIAGELMVHGAGFKKGQAVKTVGLGPFPTEVNEFLIPPTWTPIYHGLAAVAGTGGMLFGGEWKTPKRHLKGLARSMEMFAPGGLQIKKMVKGAASKDLETFMRETFNYYGGTGENFLLPIED